MELTLAIFKPHLIKNPYAVTAVKKIINQNNIKIVQQSKRHLTKELAEHFYEEHVRKFFYHRLQTFMCSGPIEVLILAGDNVITKWRTLLGPTKVYRAIYTHPNSIRGKFGLSDTRNACHGSDSMASAEREIKFFFPDFDVKKWVSENQVRIAKLNELNECRQ